MQTTIDFQPNDKFKFRFGTKEFPQIIVPFEKTPQSIVCPHFWELRWAYGCHFNCSYCYLQGTFRGHKEPWNIPLSHVFIALDNFFNQVSEPSILNSGELADSLVFPFEIEKIIDKFEEQNRHKLLLLTKSANVGFLLKKPRKQTIVSFSINAYTPAKLWEKNVPPPEKRIEAAKMVSDAGYETRIRIDPIFPIENWQEEYDELLYLIFSKFTPERITLGTPRGLKKTLLFAKDKTWTSCLTESSGWGKKIPSDVRKGVYIYFFDRLSELGFTQSKIALCKETIDIWKELKINPGNYPKWEKCKCNCVW